MVIHNHFLCIDYPGSCPSRQFNYRQQEDFRRTTVSYSQKGEITREEFEKMKDDLKKEIC